MIYCKLLSLDLLRKTRFFYSITQFDITKHNSLSKQDEEACGLRNTGIVSKYRFHFFYNRYNNVRMVFMVIHRSAWVAG